MTAARVPCPTCKRLIEWSETAPWRPFCSERCKLVDLGAWFGEQHAIAGEPAGNAEEPLTPSAPTDPSAA